jgi:hypothetical protein
MPMQVRIRNGVVKRVSHHVDSGTPLEILFGSLGIRVVNTKVLRLPVQATTRKGTRPREFPKSHHLCALVVEIVALGTVAK